MGLNAADACAQGCRSGVLVGRGVDESVEELLLFYFLQCAAPLYFGLRVEFLVCGLFFSAPCCCSVYMLIC